MCWEMAGEYRTEGAPRRLLIGTSRMLSWRVVKAPFPTEPHTKPILQLRRYPVLRWNDRESSYEAVARHRMVVGSSAASDVVINDPTVSRVHALLEPRATGILVRDLDSLNGTFVGGARVTETTLQHSGDISLGTTRLAVDFESGPLEHIEVWSEDSFHHLVGKSLAMRELFAVLQRAASTRASVLIQGETGTGKELVAHSIHDASPQAQGPFVVVDCAALPENLLDAELFGHTKGAFTGAVASRAGAIETAEGGTVFLDEVGELPMSMQPKLLRVLEQRTVRRIGETEHRPVDVRIITATHRNLLEMVARGEFREDLYFRLCVIPVTVPPLRERREDIELLVRHFLGDEPVPETLLQSLREMAWRGNVRELRNYVERAQALGERAAKQMLRSTGENPAHGSQSGRRRPTTMAPPKPPSLPSLNGVLEEEEGTLSTDKMLVRAPAPPRVPVAPSPPAGTTPGVTEPLFSENFKVFREKWIDYGEREYLQRLLQACNRNITEVAHRAAVDRTYIYRLMRKHHL
jgi:two-component system response regulator GlrR